MDELLEILARRSYCFISDLRTTETCKKLIPVLQAIQENNYSLDAWQEAFRYIVKLSPEGRDIKTMKKEMIHFLESK